MAGKTPDGGLRSYGSMTYAGLKSMIYAGVGPDDPRVKAAFKWAQKHYDLKTNPGMGTAGLYYYYHTFAKALDAMGVDRVEGRRRHRARLAPRAAPRSCCAASSPTARGSTRKPPLAGRRSRPGHRLRAADARLRAAQAEVTAPSHEPRGLSPAHLVNAESIRRGVSTQGLSVRIARARA